jgi:hypothetical protein
MPAFPIQNLEISNAPREIMLEIKVNTLLWT